LINIVSLNCILRSIGRIANLKGSYFTGEFVGLIANLKGSYFQPSLSVCMCVCLSLTGTPTLQRRPILTKLGHKDPHTLI